MCDASEPGARIDHAGRPTATAQDVDRAAEVPTARRHAPMSSRERGLVAAVVCLALLVVPMTALAATGQLVNIADPAAAGRVAKVTSDGALYVQTRPGILTGASNSQTTRTATGWASLVSLKTAGRRVAMVELTVTSIGAAGPVQVVIATALIPLDGSCSATPSSMSVLRNAVVMSPGTVQLTYSGQPIYSAAIPADQMLCFGLNLATMPTGATVRIGVTWHLNP